MIVNNLGMKNSLVNQFVAEIRNVDVQSDRMRFRKNIERLGEIFAYEISKALEWENKTINTPLGKIDMPQLKEQPIIGSILRAGLPLHQGLLNYFDQADNAFISAYRKHNVDGSFIIQLEYLCSPHLEDKILIIADPMLASGASMIYTLKEIYKFGKPRHTHIVAAISSAPGIEKVKESLDNVTLWTAAIDEELNSKAYIVPGLGDAGDLAYGIKVQQ